MAVDNSIYWHIPRLCRFLLFLCYKHSWCVDSCDFRNPSQQCADFIPCRRIDFQRKEHYEKRNCADWRVGGNWDFVLELMHNIFLYKITIFSNRYINFIPIKKFSYFYPKFKSKHFLKCDGELRPLIKNMEK